MKKLLFLSIFLCLGTYYLQAQGNFGFQFQLASNRFVQVEKQLNTKMNSTFFYSLNLLYRYSFGRIALHTGIGYVPLRYNIDLLTMDNIKTTLYYLNLPLQVNYKIPVGYLQALVVGGGVDFNLYLGKSESKSFDIASPLFNAQNQINSVSKTLQIAPKLSIAYQTIILDEEILEVGFFSSYETRKYQLVHHPYFNQDGAAQAIIRQSHALRFGVEAKLFF